MTLLSLYCVHTSPTPLTSIAQCHQSTFQGAFFDFVTAPRSLVASWPSRVRLEGGVAVRLDLTLYTSSVCQPPWNRICEWLDDWRRIEKLCKARGERLLDSWFEYAHIFTGGARSLFQKDCCISASSGGVHRTIATAPALLRPLTGGELYTQQTKVKCFVPQTSVY